MIVDFELVRISSCAPAKRDGLILAGVLALETTVTRWRQGLAKHDEVEEVWTKQFGEVGVYKPANLESDDVTEFEVAAALLARRERAFDLARAIAKTRADYSDAQQCFRKDWNVPGGDEPRFAREFYLSKAWEEMRQNYNAVAFSEGYDGYDFGPLPDCW